MDLVAVRLPQLNLEEDSDEVLQEGHAGRRLGFRLRGTHDERGSRYRYRL